MAGLWLVALYSVITSLWVFLYLCLRKPKPVPVSSRPLNVSVIVPTRNEATRLPALLEGLSQQSSPALEVLVVDDSTDGTAALARSAGVPGLRVLRTGPPPPGWIGKNHACHVGAAEAKGSWLLFLDADARLTRPDALARAVAHAERRRLSALSLYPLPWMRGFWPRVGFPLFGLLFGILTGFSLQNASWYPRRSLLGPFVLIRRDAYEGLGGHASIRDRQPDDVALAHRLGARRWEVANGREFYALEAYASGREMVDGFAKNLVGGVGGLGWALLAVFLLNVACVLPVVTLLLEPSWLTVGGWSLFFALAAALLYATTRRGGVRLFHALVWPLGIFIVNAAFLRALHWRLARGAYVWRGRTYPWPRPASGGAR